MDGLCTLYPPKRKFLTSFKWRAAATTTATAIKTSKKQYIYMYTTPRLNLRSPYLSREIEGDSARRVTLFGHLCTLIHCL